MTTRRTFRQIASVLLELCICALDCSCITSAAFCFDLTRRYWLPDMSEPASDLPDTELTDPREPGVMGC